ncbi:MAG: ABC transporter permease [Chitinophagaceae bacterium]|nr:MAG: ABC transporter permease [Chitinophagaceae bacterium]
MTRKLQFEIARELLLARGRQTLVAGVGVAFSIAAFIALLSFMTGLNDLLDGLILNRTPHVRLFREVRQNPDQPARLENPHAYHFISSVKTGNIRPELKQSAAMLAALRSDPRVMGVAPRVTTQVFFNNGTARLGAVVSGIESFPEDQLFHFYDYITEGTAQEIDVAPNSIVLGKALADKLQAEPGNLVALTTPDGKTFSLRLVALYQSGINELDKVQAFTSIATAQKLIGKPPGYLTDIQVKLTNIKMAPAVAREYSRLYATEAEDIQTASAEFETGSFIRTVISYVVGITMLIVAGFGIYNILNMMIYEKMDSIAILKATGFSGSDVKSIFLTIAVVIGLAGGIVGLAAGFGLSRIIDRIPFHATSLPTVDTYPVNYNPVYYVIGLMFALLTTYFAGRFPAAKAGKIDPVAILRGK